MWKHRQTLRRVPGQLHTDSDEARVLSDLITFVFGNPTAAVPQCSLVSVPNADFASGMFLGGNWVLSSGHFFEEESPIYQVNPGITQLDDIRKSNTFDVKSIKVSDQADLSLVQFDGSVTIAAIPIATNSELQQAGEVQLCGFGSDCVFAASGVKRLSDPVPLMPTAAAAAAGIGFNPATEFVVRGNTPAALVCDGDSGGPALIGDGAGNFKLAGIIRKQAGNGAICVRAAPFLSWIRNTTGLPV